MNPKTLVALSRNVVSKMTENTNFPTPTVLLKDISDKTAALEVAMEDATNGSQLSRIARNNLVGELKDFMRIQANYVRTVCDGNEISLASSGFALVKTRERQAIPGTPVISEIKMTGIVGQVDLKWNTQKGTRLYQVWMTESDPAVDANWLPVSATSKISATIRHLESYKAYWFCVSAIGAAGEGAKSDPSIGRAA